MKVLAVISIVIVAVIAAKLPSNFKRCNLKDLACLKTAVQDALVKLQNGAPELGIPSLDPLLVPEMTIGGGQSVVQLSQKYKNSTLEGILKGKLIEFVLDIEKGKILLKSNYDHLFVRGDYEANGKILLFPVHGYGKFEIKLDKVVGTLTFDVEVFEKNNQKYFRGKSAANKLDASFATYNFENLFDKNKELSDNLNTVLNDNWRQVFEELVPSYNKAYSQIFLQMMNRLFSKVPLSEIFLDQ